MDITESLSKINLIKKKLNGHPVKMTVFKINLKGEHYFCNHDVNFADVNIIEKDKIIFLVFPDKLSRFNDYLIDEKSWTVDTEKGLMNFYTISFMKYQFNFHYK